MISNISQEWIVQPFIVDIKTVKMATDMENQLIEVTYYPKLKQMLIATSLVIF